MSDMKQKYLLLLLVVVLVSFVFLYSSSKMISAKIDKIERIDKKIKKTQEKLNSAQVLNQQLSQVSKVIDNTLTSDKTYSADEANAFVKQLADLADQYKVAVYGVFPKNTSNDVNLLEQQYTMEIECTYVQLGQFMTSLESYDRIVKVNTLDVRPILATGKDKPQFTETHYRVTLELSTFKIVKEA